MKKIALLGLFGLASIGSAFSQTQMDVPADQPLSQNGVNYGYRIRNEQTIEIKDEKYSRYEVEVFVTNVSGCSKIWLHRDLRDYNLGSGSKPYSLAFFDCLNATGKRLTSTSHLIDASPYIVQQRVSQATPDGKTNYSYSNADLGYGIRNSETINANIIIITPLGQKPKFTVKFAQNFSNL